MTEGKAEDVTILHISDFHFKPNTKCDKKIILSGLLETIKGMHKTEWQPDLIACTGDIAYSGKPEEYKSAIDFFDQLRKTTTTPEKGGHRLRFFAVPGNHDIDWDEPSPAEEVEFQKDEDADSFFESQVLKNILKKLHGYQQFSRRYLKQQFDENHLYFTNIIRIGRFQVGIAGLNSAWPYHKKMFKKSSALDQLLGRIPLKNALDQIKQADLKIVMFHHPVPWMIDFEQPNIRSLLEEHADLVLNGHQDKPNTEIHQVGEERRVLYIQGGPAYEARWPSRINLIRWETQGNCPIVKIHPLKFDREANKWVLDTSRFPKQPGYIGHYHMTQKTDTSKTGKALIITVGTGTGPAKKAMGNLADGLADAIEAAPSDKVFFVISQQSQQTMEKIMQKMNIPNYETILIGNVNNIRQIYEELQPHFQRIRKQYNRVMVDFTSGTKPMSAALSMLGAVYKADKLNYLGGGKRKWGVVPPNLGELYSIPPHFLTTDLGIRTAEQFFNQNQFGAAIILLDRVEKSADPEKRNDIESLRNTAKAFELWDKFQHRKAFQTLRKIKKEELDLSKSFLGQMLTTKEPEPYYIADLLNNAKRRGSEERRYDDAIARLYRAIELIAQHKLKKEYGIDSSAAKPSDVPEELLKKWNDKTSTEIKIGLQKAYELLEAKKHPLGTKFMQDRKLKDLLSKRNTSILAHNLIPTTRKTYMELYLKTIEYAASTTENLNQLVKNSTFIKLE
jgi:CRISPR-associated protein (TIGR02710 family)